MHDIAGRRLSISPDAVRRMDRDTSFLDTDGRVPSLPDRRTTTMRFMILLKGDKTTEAGVLPDEKMLAAMGAYNEELVKAGVMIAGEGLKPTSRGARIRFSGSSRTVIDGPFVESKELIAGFWIFDVKSKEEAIEWVKRCPNPLEGEAEIEIRQLYEASDFGDEFTPELREQEERLREHIQTSGKSL
jgi:hypothetical protein